MLIGHTAQWDNCLKHGSFQLNENRWHGDYNSSPRPISIICICLLVVFLSLHDDIMAWKRFPHYRHSVRAIHEWPAKSPIKGSVKQNFYVLSAVSLNKMLMLNQQLSYQWFEMPSHSFHVTVLSPPFPISFFLPRTPKTPGANLTLFPSKSQKPLQ